MPSEGSGTTKKPFLMPSEGSGTSKKPILMPTTGVGTAKKPILMPTTGIGTTKKPILMPTTGVGTTRCLGCKHIFELQIHILRLNGFVLAGVPAFCRISEFGRCEYKHL